VCEELAEEVDVVVAGVVAIRRHGSLRVARRLAAVAQARARVDGENRRAVHRRLCALAASIRTGRRGPERGSAPERNRS